MTPMADRDVRVYEVGPRDGLQNEAAPIPTDAKLRFIDLLASEKKRYETFQSKYSADAR